MNPQGYVTNEVTMISLAVAALRGFTPRVIPSVMAGEAQLRHFRNAGSFRS